MKKNVLSLFAVTVLASFCASCRSPETGAYLPQNTNKFDAELKNRFVLMDAGAQRSITCMGIRPTPLPDGRLQVDALVRNRENRRLQVQIQCEFKDALGFAVDSPAWENLILTENSTETKTFVSLNDKAKDYTVRVREAR